MKAEKIFIDKDDAGRERRVIMTNVRSDFWEGRKEQPGQRTKTFAMHGSESVVEARGIQMLAEDRLEFKQARNRGDQPYGMQPDRSHPVPPDPPIGLATSQHHGDIEMSRMDRLKEYSGKPRGLQGEGRSEANLKGWSERASDNSQDATRASDGEMVLPSTKQTVRDTSMKPKEQRKVDAAMAGRGDLNHVGTGSYLKNIRRDG